ncbi:integral membrane channel protein, putative [Paecilomyces variotii No. 5]|uniref:Integral membrane channel protein, putative n=1 Tax=Byssochlamys spectabilis (strain No. 5 / NBRC 109023) TaxID=1356009 RepID=V5G059_BYSSN|nr:integral membrane channel protein, putative [Paecilomyces variotii No. 5]
MLASLLRPKKRRAYTERSPFAAPSTARESSPLLRRHNAPESADDASDEDEGTGYEHDPGDELEEEEDDAQEDEDGPGDSPPLLPIFSAPYLDALPVYNITHTIRILVSSRCETTLTWDQLRSPQVSQFLIKPIQQQIMASHFSRATLYALMANCLQFNKEVDLNPGNSGTNRTRAMVCELLAIKLLKEYTTRELIDALSYDFYPLQGHTPPTTGSTLRGPGWSSSHRSKRLPGTARISCLEIAIRTQAKRFIAHPLVVQQLEAIWAGTIVFHSAADNLHRQPPDTLQRDNARGYGSFHAKVQLGGDGREAMNLRRSVTLYDPRDASLFKLSRLRVPRYRQFLSTCSFAVLLGLFLAIIIQRPLEITTLEVLFWFWSAGFMLDELVGFNEQGFSLYIMSFWNTFDLGILLLLICYYCMRIYGVLMPYTRKQMVADQAYDILAANAVLLFPRLFSVLDHYPYFSQLLIAFRMMASDLVAVFTLIIIACSGFFVAFTFSFGDGGDPSSVAYALFQMLMGFTPAAWTLWEEYNVLGKTILTLFLFICHFVVVTILITVLTNSFMAIVQNANEEHQFVFAVNTISMVKSDALFSYVAPTNILAWLIAPLRFCMPFRQFLKINRMIIKITHFPILFTICLYERTILSSKVFEPTDLVDAQARTEPSGRRRRRLHFEPFSPNARRRVREPSIATYQKDRALDEVFRRPFAGDTTRYMARDEDRRKTSNIVKDWMRGMEPEPAHPPDEQDPDEVNRLEALPQRPRPSLQRRNRLGTIRDFTETTRSVASDPEEFINNSFAHVKAHRRGRDLLSPTRTRQLSRHTDVEGDDELTSEDNEDGHSVADRESLTGPHLDEDEAVSPKNTSRSTPKFSNSRPSTAKVSRKSSPTRQQRPTHRHERNMSSATILYAPVQTETENEIPQATSPLSKSIPKSIPKSPHTCSGAITPVSTGRRTPKRSDANTSRPRPIMPPRSNFSSEPDMAVLAKKGPRSVPRRPPPIPDLGSDLGDNKAIGGGFVPSSFATQMAYATGGLRRAPESHETQDMLSKLVLARMNNLEESFREVIKEVKDLRQGSSSRSQSQGEELRSANRERPKSRDKKIAKKKKPTSKPGKTSSDED